MERDDISKNSLLSTARLKLNLKEYGKTCDSDYFSLFPSQSSALGFCYDDVDDGGVAET